MIEAIIPRSQLQNLKVGGESFYDATPSKWLANRRGESLQPDIELGGTLNRILLITGCRSFLGQLSPTIFAAATLQQIVASCSHRFRRKYVHIHTFRARHFKTLAQSLNCTVHFLPCSPIRIRLQFISTAVLATEKLSPLPVASLLSLQECRWSFTWSSNKLMPQFMNKSVVVHPSHVHRPLCMAHLVDFLQSNYHRLLPPHCDYKLWDGRRLSDPLTSASAANSSRCSSSRSRWFSGLPGTEKLVSNGGKKKRNQRQADRIERCPFAQSGQKDNTVRSVCYMLERIYILKSTCAELNNTIGLEIDGLDGDEPGENEGHQNGGAHETEGEHVEALLGEDVGECGYILVDLLDHRQCSFVLPHHPDGYFFLVAFFPPPAPPASFCFSALVRTLLVISSRGAKLDTCLLHSCSSSSVFRLSLLKRISLTWACSVNDIISISVCSLIVAVSKGFT